MKMKIKMKNRIRQFMAMFLCILMISKLVVPTLATVTATDSNATKTEHIVLNTGENYSKQSEKETPSNAFKATPSDATNKGDMPKIGDIIWIRSGSYVYDSISDGEKYELVFTYEVKIADIIYGDNNEAEWYEIKCKNTTTWWWNIFIGKQFKYVHVEDTSITEPSDKEESTAEIILSELEQLENIYESITEDDCEEFYSQMMKSYSKAFENDVLIVSTEELEQIDEQFCALENALYLDHGYSDITAPVTLIADMETPEEQSTTDVESSLHTDKWVSVSNNNDSDYVLTLESYVKGQSEDYTQPVDLILVLDQSASMYGPMGISAGLKNDTIFKDSSTDIIRYAFNNGPGGTNINGTLDIKEQLKDEAFMKSIAQLGYLVAQSRVGGGAYCKKKHAADAHVKDEVDCWTYDWFIVQYVKDDSDNKPWHMYRVTQTANPSRDRNRDFTYDNYECLKYSTEEIGSAHFYFYKSQSGALHDAITSFANKLKASEGDHRLAVTGFASGIKHPVYDPADIQSSSGIYIGDTFIPYSTESGRTGSGSEKWDWITDANEIYKMSTITKAQAASALMSVQDDWSDITKAIDSVKTDYYETFQNVGLDIALKIVRNAPAVTTDLEGYTRKKIVVLFTDGEPAGPDKDDIVAKAKELKDAGAEIYTVCTSTLPEDKREFLNYSSSDYPDAVRVESPGTRATEKYTKTAKNSEELVNQFLSIIEDVGGAYIATLGTSTILQDAITDDFTLPKELINALKTTAGPTTDLIKKYIKVYTADYMGNNTFAEKQPFDATIEFSQDSDSDYSIVMVSGFDYSANYVSENPRKNGGTEKDFYGKKLIVEIAIGVADTNLGGNKQPTNIPEKSGIYVPKSPENERLKGFPLPYVDVPTTVTVTKNVDGRNADKTRKFNFTVTASGSNAYIYDKTENYLKMKDGTQKPTFSLEDNGTETISKVYVGSTFVISETEDQYYTPSIQVFNSNGNDITDQAIKNENGRLEIRVVPGMQIVYTNTVTLADLVIKKTGIQSIDENQSCIFKVTGPNDFSMDVVVVGNDSVTIKDLPVGKYTVQEMTDWTWRYTIETILPNDGKIDVTANGNNQVTFTNTRDEEYWLSGDSYCSNWWGGKSDDGTSGIVGKRKSKLLSGTNQ